MLSNDEREAPWRGRWPTPAIVMFLVGLAAVVFFGYHSNRGLPVLGLPPSAVLLATILSFVATMTIPVTLALRSRRSQPP